MSLFGSALGIEKLEVNGTKAEITPTADDCRRFRNIALENANKPSLQMRLWEKLMTEVLVRDTLPPGGDVEAHKKMVSDDVTVYFTQLLPQFMVALKFKTKEELDAMNAQAIEGVKKKIASP